MHTRGLRLLNTSELEAAIKAAEQLQHGRMRQDPGVEDVVGLLLFLPELREIAAGLPRPASPGEPGRPTDADLSAAEALVRLGRRLAPKDLLWGAFPADGGMEPIPAGRLEIDLLNRQATLPGGATVGESTLELNIASDVLEAAQSFVLVVDQLVKVELSPQSGSWPQPAGFFQGNARKLERISISSDEPYNMLLFIGTALRTADYRGLTARQQRESAVTLTKVAGAGVEDPLAAVTFVPRYQDKSLTMSEFGVTTIRTEGYSQKVLVVRNTDAAQSVEANLFGRMFESNGFILDPDSLPSGGGRVTIAAGDQHVFESGIPWNELQLRMAVAAAEAPAAQASVVVEYQGQTPSVR